MRFLLRYVIPVAIFLIILAAFRYFFPESPTVDVEKLQCTFESAGSASAARLPGSREIISEIKFEGELSNGSVHEGTTLWSAHGIAFVNGTSQELAGPVFVASTGKVRSLALYRDRSPHQATDLRIITLNENGKLDSNEHSAFVYFENEAAKMAHPYNYRCLVIAARDR